MLIDTAGEVSLGRDMDSQVSQKLKLINEPSTLYRLQRIGERVARDSDRQDIAYHFRVVRDNELNAFALPGGYVLSLIHI